MPAKSVPMGIAPPTRRTDQLSKFYMDHHSMAMTLYENWSPDRLLSRGYTCSPDTRLEQCCAHAYMRRYQSAT